MMNIVKYCFLILGVVPCALGAVVSFGDKDVAPMLGRGFSATNGEMFTTCMSYGETRDSSYDYDFQYREISNDRLTIEASRNALRSVFENNDDTTVNKSESKRNSVLGLLSVDRYGYSIDDTTASLTATSLSLIKRNDLIGFFSTCGPSYIRTLRRSAQLVTIFSWTQVGTSYNKEFESAIGQSILSLRSSNSTKKSSISDFSQAESVKIDIKAFGLDLFQSAGTGTLVTNSIRDVDQIIDFAFASMTSEHAGVITSVEVVPWTSDAGFQAAITIPSNILGTGPSHALQKVILIQNSVFITGIATNVREKLYKISLIQNCLGYVTKLPSSYSSRTVFELNCLFGNACPTKTVEELKCDLKGEVTNSPRLSTRENRHRRFLYSRQTSSLLAYVENYFDPCMQAFTSIDGSSEETLFTTVWSSIPACQDLKCQFKSSYWDENTRACEIGEPISVDAEALRSLENYCMPMFHPSEDNETEELVCNTNDIDDFCEDEQATSNYLTIGYYVNRNSDLNTDDECNSCSNSFLRFQFEMNPDRCHSITGLYSEDVLEAFPSSSRSSVQIVDASSTEMTVTFYENTCNCNTADGGQVGNHESYTETCKVASDPRFCIKIID